MNNKQFVEQLFSMMYAQHSDYKDYFCWVFSYLFDNLEPVSLWQLQADFCRMTGKCVPSGFDFFDEVLEDLVHCGYLQEIIPENSLLLHPASHAWQVRLTPDVWLILAGADTLRDAVDE